ncbi:methyltransferase domain-containing protein [Flavobacterium sp. Sd200]|uniref:class I SAM-dependent methyltransferase n=1 Tax=Flavobacterium sp. Sd200 TaxID=2692211 RepID=UPI00136DED71|nr:class I SAM-dependent methyltransferase [Flavobacterium sp. Sd200]MXN90032.1 methyltransferase domain-containing protein [Flavobacterium sp. Sd200]
MKTEDNYIALNKKAWNNKIPVHVASDFYDMPGFMAGKCTLKDIELKLLGNFANKKVLHLQCHFGQDTISLARLGANATGVDFSDAAIQKAQDIAAELDVPAQFICCDIYSLPEVLHEKFDVVFTSYGTIGWLPDLDRWASVISHFLKPGGTFVIAEFHPVLWMFNNDFTAIIYRYFKSNAIIEDETGTYANTNAPITNQTVSWNHSLTEVINSLIKQNLTIEMFNEYDYSPYNCFNGMAEFEPGKFRIANLGDKIPMVYSIKAIKNS